MIIDDLLLGNLIEAAPILKKVVRGGKIIKKKKCPPGYKLVDGRKCVKMSTQEKLTRKKAGKKAARKGKSQRKISRRRSTRVRRRLK